MGLAYQGQKLNQHFEKFGNLCILRISCAHMKNILLYFQAYRTGIQNSYLSHANLIRANGLL